MLGTPAALRRSRQRLTVGPARRQMLIGAGGGQLVLLLPMLWLERRMRRTGGPGIIGFELARTPERARQIMQDWGPEGRSAARASLLLDYPYLVTYCALNATICAIAADALRHRGSRWLADAGRTLSAAQWTAGGFDAVENAALLAVLGARNGGSPAIAATCAYTKFALIALGWSYAGVGLVARLRHIHA